MKLIPPRNFIYHNENIIFSGYPDIENIRFIKSLGFRKFINVCEIWPKPHEAALAKELQIKLMHYPLTVGEYSFSPIDEDKLAAIINIIVQEINKGSKIYVYDEVGTKKVGLISAILRKIEKWDLTSVLLEYQRIAGTDASNFSTRFVCNYNISRWH